MKQMDRDKVIGHLNDCMESSRRDNTWVFVRKDIVEDAIVLLKEQEAVEPFHKCIDKDFALIEDSHFDYCPYCGKPITWSKLEGQ